MTIKPSVLLNKNDYIPSLWTQAISSKDVPSVDLWETLGVHRTDEAARRILLPLMKEACNKETEIKPDEKEEESGVYFLSRPGDKPFAVFKVGLKRAYEEMAARQIAHTMGLAKHAIPVVFCSIANPTFPKKGAIIEELWNGNQKVFPADPKGEYRKQILEENYGLDTPPTLSGVFEPYLSPQGKKEVSVGDFASMTVLASALGLRDAKPDGISATPLPGEERGPVLFDLEECMTHRVLPEGSPNRFVAALHMPYLNNPLSEQEIPADVRKELRGKVEHYANALEERLEELRAQKVVFADLSSEGRYSIEDVVAIMDRLKGLAHTYSLANIDDAKWATLCKHLKKNPKHQKAILKMIHNIRHADKHREKKLFPQLDQFCSKFSRGTEDEKFSRLFSSWDQGGCPVTIEKTKQVMEASSTKQVKDGTPLFSEEQLKAFSLRIQGLRDHFMKDSGNILHMVGDVDPLYKEHLDSLGNRQCADLVGVVKPADAGPLNTAAIDRIHLSPTFCRSRDFSFTQLSRASSAPVRRPGLRMRERPLSDQEGSGIEMSFFQKLLQGAQPVKLSIESGATEST